ncbi:SsrA RNA (tmRNA)-binding protein [Metamycoplasma arthritidis]|uniref:SsrA-binding protein n=1 Tax=Metamycoplasma arthritidis (strain 158L3-1) TaxID=243272 RepID=B3PM30_META1|nr:SsrA-binding protein SmpB [Metamycoplasma arthritidis]ACF07082.1 SsrA-binding protein [Metamycoplasma arthritidis 158L3-1]VEU78610.1 SsrA RNA (tmRNA)-binding protein [Metamycoplasma arthritidis]
MALIVKNKFPKLEYEIHSTYECGISLLGWEAKSLRAKNAKLESSFCSISQSDELWLNNAYIAQYMLVKGDPLRSRKLLMHRHEIKKLRSLQQRLNLIFIPLSFYWRGNKIKVEIALAKHLNKHDKREKIKKDEAKKFIKAVLY